MASPHAYNLNSVRGAIFANAKLVGGNWVSRFFWQRKIEHWCPIQCNFRVIHSGISL